MVANYKQKVLSGFAWEAGTKLIVQVLSWVSTIWVARLLSPDDYGIVLISGLFTGFLTMLAGFGVNSGVIHRTEISRRELSSVFWFCLTSGLLAYIILFLCAPFIASKFSSPELSGILKVAGIIIILSSLNIVPHAIMMRQLNFRFSALVDMGSKLILIVTTLVMAYSGYGYWSLIISTLACNAFLLIAYMLAMESKISFTIDPKQIKDIIYFGLKVLSSRLLFWWNSSTASVFTSVLWDKTIAGHLQMANSLATIPLTKVGEIFDRIAFPAIAAIKGDKTRAKNVFLKIHGVLLLITCPMFIGIAAIAEELVPLLMGEKWLPIILPLQILCLNNVTRISSQLIPRVLEGVGQPSSSAKFELFTAILCPIGMFLGSPYGLDGLLFGWLITMPVVYIYLFILVKRHLNIKTAEYAKSIAPSIFSSLLIILSCFIVGIALEGQHLLLIMMAKIIIGMLVFASSYYILNKQHIFEIISLIKNRA